MNVKDWVHSSFVRVSAPIGARSLPKVWGRPCWEGVFFSGCIGCCGFARDSQLVEFPEELWAGRRALLLPRQKEPTIHEKVVVSERDTEDGSIFFDQEGGRNVVNLSTGTLLPSAAAVWRGL